MSTRQTSAKETSLTVRRAGAPIPVGTKSAAVDEIINVVKGGFSKAQITDPFTSSYGTADGGDLSIIAPPVNPAVLLRLTKENSSLKQLIEAMVTNVCGHGHRLEYIGPEDAKDSDAAMLEMQHIQSFLDAPNDEYSMLELRRRVRWDMEAIGYAFIEVARDRKGRVSAAWHLPAHLTRICAADKEGVDVTMEFNRFGQVVRQKVKKHFRRFVQIKGTKKVYFKEFGDPRIIDPASGKESKSLGFEDSATEVIHIPLYHAGELYGLPRWINNMVAIAGARQAELTNLDFFSENAIPALAVMVSGGGLTQASLDALEGHLTAIRGRQAMNRVLVLEAYADENAAAENGTIPPPKVDLKPLSGERAKDGLFLEYDKVQTGKIRSSFRLPPIFVGVSEDYTRATANTSYEVAESQLFGPERVREDDIINRKILSTYGVQFWEVRSNPPRISDPQEVVNALTAFEQAGAMTPNIAIGLANEMFDLDIEPISEEWGNFPFSVVQSLAVQGKVTGWEGIIIEDPEPTSEPASDQASDPGANTVGGQPEEDPSETARAVVRRALLDLRDVVKTAAEAQRLMRASEGVRERKRPEGA